MMEALSFSNNLRSGQRFKVAIEPSIVFHTRRLEELGVGIRSFREPLEISIREVMRPSIRTNFDVGGRPKWAELAASTIAKREKKGTGTKTLVEKGTLRKIASQRNIWDVSSTVALVRGFALLERVPYAGYQQTGTGKGMKAIPMKDERGRNIFGVGDSMPARPYLFIQEEDIEKIEQIFLEWIEMRIAKYWARRG